MHLALRHSDSAILASSDDFLTLFRSHASNDCYFVMEGWLTSGSNRRGKLLDGLNKLCDDHWEEPGQRVDLAIAWLREQGVLCERYTSKLLRESHYGQLPSGSVAALAIAVGEREPNYVFQ